MPGDGSSSAKSLTVRLRMRLAPMRIGGYRRFRTARVLSVTGSSMSPVASAFAVLRLGGSVARWLGDRSQPGADFEHLLADSLPAPRRRRRRPAVGSS